MTSKLNFNFYNREATTVAPELIGKILVKREPGTLLRARIVETEAYMGALDQASHSYRGQTKRNQVMFGPPGHLYVYFTYGLHYCANVVAGSQDDAQAALLRAAEPLEGLETMQQRRGTVNPLNLCNGPAKLAQAFGLNLSHNGQNLVSSNIWIEDDKTKVKLIVSTRIGISQATSRPWRYYQEGSKWVSKPNKNRYNASYGRNSQT